MSFNLKLTVAAANTTNSGIPYQTYTLGEYGRQIPTQAAYIPVGVFGRSLELNSPQDIFFFNDNLYIADTGNKRIIVINTFGELIQVYENEEFMSPMGVFVNDQYLFVADKQAKAVFQIDLITSELILKIEKPSSPIFGQKNEFLPVKVVVNSSDSIFIVGEGSNSGIIQMNYAGEFIGYLGINTVSMSFRKILYNFFVKSSDLASSLPPSPNNISLGKKGTILTTNINVNETFKRLNISGVNTLLASTVYPNTNLSDIWMNNESYIYLVSAKGDVYEYDANGNMLFYFNINDSFMTQTLGLTSSPSGVCTDDAGNLYILDKGYNFINVYQKTVFVDLIHDAVTLYNNGQYIESKPIWEEILRQNSSFALAHSALGSALTKEGDFDNALSEFHDAKDYNGYSNAFWEIRNVEIQNNLTKWLMLLVLLVFIIKAIKYIFKKDPFNSYYLSLKQRFLKIKVFLELSITLQIFKKPNDVFYLIKQKKKASYLSAFIVLGLFVIVYLINIYSTGFLFKSNNLNNVIIQFTIIFGVFILYTIVNYLISTFYDGEGRFKDIFIASSYALLPFIILTLPMTFLSHYLTYNESFIYNFYNQIVVGWTVFLMILSIKQIHNYTVFETIKNIIFIIFGMAIVVLIGLLIYSFIGQFIDFIISIVKEVLYRG